MLKLYRAYANHGEVGLDNYITFDHGRFNTGYQGFGEVIGKFGTHESNFKYNANYILSSLQSFKDYLMTIKKNDGFVQNLRFFNVYSMEDLYKKFGDVEKNATVYNSKGLDEEAIVLFTDFVDLKSSDGLTQRFFGRDSHTGMYILQPGASVSMRQETACDNKTEDYEVLQSQTLGKRLVLTKFDRKI